MFRKMFKCKYDSVQLVILRADPCKPRGVDADQRSDCVGCRDPSLSCS